jgi:hypothetical protein
VRPSHQGPANQGEATQAADYPNMNQPTKICTLRARLIKQEVVDGIISPWRYFAIGCLQITPLLGTLPAYVSSLSTPRITELETAMGNANDQTQDITERKVHEIIAVQDLTIFPGRR